MPNRLLGKVAVVTGAASGIGAATARLFLEEGASVILADLNEPVDERLLGALAQDRARAEFVRTDVANEESVKATIARAVGKWDRLNTAISCAGVSGPGSDVDLTQAEWDRIMAVNARGPFFVTKHALPEMLKRGGGSIVNISSAYGIVGAPGYAAYCASKGAVRMLTKSTAVEHAAQGIRANSIHPGAIDTPMLQATINMAKDPVAARQYFSSQQPSGVFGQPEDIAWGCVYLASDEARFVNGAELVIDAGFVAR
jgi:NAD(P)-dependent dehydrogenase (short-subunit alcohol dehydrogenase family)